MVVLTRVAVVMGLAVVVVMGVGRDGGLWDVRGGVHRGRKDFNMVIEMVLAIEVAVVFVVKVIR